MNWIQRLLGLEKFLCEIKKTNALLEEIAKETKRNADLQKRYNDAYHIK